MAILLYGASYQHLTNSYTHGACHRPYVRRHVYDTLYPRCPLHDHEGHLTILPSYHLAIYPWPRGCCMLRSNPAARTTCNTTHTTLDAIPPRPDRHHTTHTPCTAVPQIQGPAPTSQSGVAPLPVNCVDRVEHRIAVLEARRIHRVEAHMSSANH